MKATRSTRYRYAAAAAVVAAGALIPWAGAAFLQENPDAGLAAFRGAEAGRDFVVYVDAKAGEDISARFQAALDKVRHNGGTVVLPPGSHRMTKGVSIAPAGASRQGGYITGITIDGNGCRLIWDGEDKGAVIDLPGPWGCTIRSLAIQGERGRYFRNLVGVRYRGGIERKANGGKNNRFESITVNNVGVCFEVGNLFGPDLVGGTFINTAASNCRIGYRIMGANVTAMVFINPLVSGFEEAGFKILGHTARKIRKDENDEIPEPEAPGHPAILMDENGEREIFQKDLPDWITAPDVKYPTWWGEFRGYQALWAGGGTPDVTIYGLLGHSSHVDSWVIDTNWGLVRVYSARVEGMGGFFRSTHSDFPLGQYANVLVDVGTNALGLNGNAIELHGEGPLYLIGGSYRANVAVGQDSVVYAVGTRFLPWGRKMTALMSPDWEESPREEIQFTDEMRTRGYLRGKSRVVKIDPPEQPGFVRLPGTSGARVHELNQSAHLTADVPEGVTSVKVKLGGLSAQADSNYQASATPSFNAGALWVSEKQPESLTVDFEKPAPAGARMDVQITHDPFRNRNY